MRRRGKSTGTFHPVQIAVTGDQTRNGFQITDRRVLCEGPRDIKVFPGRGRLPDREVDVTPDLAAFKMSNRIGRVISGGHVALHEYIAKIMACFTRFERFSIFIDRTKFRSLFESQWMRKDPKNGSFLS